MEPLDIMSKVINQWVADATSKDKRKRAEAWNDFMVASQSPNLSPVLNIAARATGSTPKQVLQAMAKTARQKAGYKTGIVKQ